MFSIETSLKYGWEKFKQNLSLSIMVMILMFAIDFLNDEAHWVTSVLLSILSIIVSIGWLKIILRIHDGESPKFEDVFKEYKKFWYYLGATILMGIAVVAGLIVLVIPGIILLIRLAFGGLIIVDTNAGPIAALKESWAITKGMFWKLLLFALTILGLNILGAIVFGVGLIITIPVSFFAYSHVYRELSKSKAAVMVEPAPTT